MALTPEDFKSSFCFKKIVDTHPVTYMFSPEEGSKFIGRIYCDWIYQGFVFVDYDVVSVHHVIAGIPLNVVMNLSDYEKVESTKLTPKK